MFDALDETGDGQINHDDFYVPDADAGRQSKNQGATDRGFRGLA
jgi:hypothetical protein